MVDVMVSIICSVCISVHATFTCRDMHVYQNELRNSKESGNGQHTCLYSYNYIIIHVHTKTNACPFMHTHMQLDTHADSYTCTLQFTHTQNCTDTVCCMHTCTHLQVSNSELAMNSSSRQLLQCCLSA